MAKPHVIVLYGYGLNCDIETAYAFSQAGAEARRVHINTLIAGEVNLLDFHIAAFVGGFGWGDDHGAGVIQALRLTSNMGENFIRFIEQGGLMIGICNGFQVLINMGLLPGFDGNYQHRSLALTFNDSGKFRNDWVTLTTNPDTSCVFTQGIHQIDLPIRHGEGKFYAENSVMQRLAHDKQIVLRYALPDGTPAQGKFPHNPNGSLSDIAGICDATGRVFGLMPHPESFIHPANHPQYTRTRQLAKRGSAKLPNTADGLLMFHNAVKYFG